jgi:transcriptional regulator with GAF, ATPase, and Fis domain
MNPASGKGGTCTHTDRSGCGSVDRSGKSRGWCTFFPMTDRAAASRDFPRLFRAMNEVLAVLAEGGGEDGALVGSFASVAEGFAADRALLLLVDDQDSRQMRHLVARGLDAAQVAACEKGESVPGVSASVIRAAVRSRTTVLVPRPRLEDTPSVTPALAGVDYSVLCAPLVDPVRDAVFAVLYFQNHAADPAHGYSETDADWLRGYAAAAGRAFAFHFQEQKRARELEALLQGVERPEDAPDILGDSASTAELRRLLHETYIPAAEAPDPEPILILGEKGTGKDLVARYLHAYSARRDRPFVVLSGAEITDELAPSRFFGHKRGAFTGALSDEPGVFRAAHRGTLFLDEIGELSPRAQAVLLRTLENRTVVPVGETREVRVDVQVVLATNRDVDLAVREGALRADFLDRFRTHAIRLEPLRDRPWDVPTLVRHFVGHHERRMRKKTLGLTHDAARVLTAHSWPGNVRELARVCSLLVTHARPGTAIDRVLVERCYPEAVRSPPNPKAAPLVAEDLPLEEAVRVFQRELLLARLERHGGSLRAARESLGVPKTTFRRYLIELGIRSADAAEPDEDR